MVSRSLLGRFTHCGFSPTVDHWSQTDDVTDSGASLQQEVSEIFGLLHVVTLFHITEGSDVKIKSGPSLTEVGQDAMFIISSYLM